MFDDNKNVTDLTTPSGIPAAHYDYAPFGALTRAVGPAAHATPYRFSSEYHDDELDLVYYNYRHYFSLNGRWLSRDRNEDSKKEVNLYVIVLNSPQNQIDNLGLECWSGVIYCFPGGGEFPVPCQCSYPPCPKDYKVKKDANGQSSYRTKTDIGGDKEGNGCGSEGGMKVPDTYLGVVNFKDCCNKHDKCYGTCDSKKSKCDSELGSCMYKQCTDNLSFLDFLNRKKCTDMAAAYEIAVRLRGANAYEAAQDKTCKWELCCGH